MTTPSTTTYRRGDVVLVPFLYTDRPAFKNRPAVIVSSDAYHAGRREVIIAAVTSRVRQPLLPGDHLIGRWRESGLPKPSVATAIIRTARGSMIIRRLGTLAERDLRAVDAGLAEALALPQR